MKIPLSELRKALASYERQIRPKADDYKFSDEARKRQKEEIAEQRAKAKELLKNALGCLAAYIDWESDHDR